MSLLGRTGYRGAAKLLRSHEQVLWRLISTHVIAGTKSQLPSRSQCLISTSFRSGPLLARSTLPWSVRLLSTKSNGSSKLDQLEKYVEMDPADISESQHKRFSQLLFATLVDLAERPLVFAQVLAAIEIEQKGLLVGASSTSEEGSDAKASQQQNEDEDETQSETEDKATKNVKLTPKRGRFNNSIRRFLCNGSQDDRLQIRVILTHCLHLIRPEELREMAEKKWKKKIQSVLSQICTVCDRPTYHKIMMHTLNAEQYDFSKRPRAIREFYKRVKSALQDVEKPTDSVGSQKDILTDEILEYVVFITPNLLYDTKRHLLKRSHRKVVNRLVARLNIKQLKWCVKSLEDIQNIATEPSDAKHSFRIRYMREQRAAYVFGKSMANHFDLPGRIKIIQEEVDASKQPPARKSTTIPLAVSMLEDHALLFDQQDLIDAWNKKHKGEFSPMNADEEVELFAPDRDDLLRFVMVLLNHLDQDEMRRFRQRLKQFSSLIEPNTHAQDYFLSFCDTLFSKHDVGPQLMELLKKHYLDLTDGFVARVIEESHLFGAYPYMAGFLHAKFKVDTKPDPEESKPLIASECFDAFIKMEDAYEAIDRAHAEFRPKIFIENLPVDMTVPALAKLCSVYGRVIGVEIYKDRLQKEILANIKLFLSPDDRFHRKERETQSYTPVHAFVYFASHDGYRRMLSTSNQMFGILVNNNRCSIAPSSDKTVLFVGNIHKRLKAAEIVYAINTAVEGRLPYNGYLANVYTMSGEDWSKTKAPSAYFMVEFDSHLSAVHAYRLLLHVDIQGRPLKVGWGHKPKDKFVDDDVDDPLADIEMEYGLSLYEYARDSDT